MPGEHIPVDTFRDNINAQNDRLAKLKRDELSKVKQDIIWGFIEVVCADVDFGVGELADNAEHYAAVAENFKIGGVTYKAAEAIKEGKKERSERQKPNRTKDNPYFSLHGFDQTGDKFSPKTLMYVQRAQKKKIGSSMSGLAGALAKPFTYVNVTGIILHGQSFHSTRIHLKVFNDMAKKLLPKSNTIAGWLTVLIKAKETKRFTKGCKLTGASIPLIPGIGAITGLLAYAVKIDAKIGQSEACVAAALELHWRAFQEQRIAKAKAVLGVPVSEKFHNNYAVGSEARNNLPPTVHPEAYETGGDDGPACKILYELFRHYGFAKILAPEDVDAIIQEPAGWMAIKEKLLAL
ncbi:MAG: hypothetical protein CMI02_04515 [Oceanospirillaceae bacterium]|nr:hypothetical protein [Oceanospirillaceae bacterium]MBT11282.1 hypothetical protein [Oceanospirillaceae bacterium]|tara:strand:+ start:142260 stop:143309 length:1050 start_codon:yes stop_codon:yes gene_type:complete